MESIARQAEVFPSIHCSRKASFRQKNHKLFRFTILNKRLFPSGTSPLGRLLKWMGRRAISEFQVKQTSYPNAGRSWYIVGRPGGKRIREWFDTESVAEAEATQRNLSIQRFGPLANRPPLSRVPSPIWRWNAKVGCRNTARAFTMPPPIISDSPTPRKR